MSRGRTQSFTADLRVEATRSRVFSERQEERGYRGLPHLESTDSRGAQSRSDGCNDPPGSGPRTL
jgi:hypothetical protein